MNLFLITMVPLHESLFPIFNKKVITLSFLSYFDEIETQMKKRGHMTACFFFN